MDTDDYARRTERIKHLLSSYYGGAPAPGGAGGGATAGALQQQQAGPGSPHAAGPGGGGGGGGAEDPGGAAAAQAAGQAADGGAAFNADRHVSALIQGASIERLLSEHRAMAREIKNLDSDMQQLVYENYNKFIAATDTIRSMKTNVDAMEADMDALRTSMDTVAQHSSAVNAKLLKRRQHIEELNRVQSLLDKLEAVFELPSRMQAALQDDALSAAVSYYAEAQPVLRAYGHKGGFRDVAAAADAAAKDIAAVLKRRLAERKHDTEQVVLLLRQLGEADNTLQEKYLQGRLERMQRILCDAAAVADVMAAAVQMPLAEQQQQQQQPGAAAARPHPSLASVDGPEGWGVAPNGSPPALPVFVKALDERLINALQETVINVSCIFLQDDRSAARRKPLITVAKEVVGTYFKVMRRVVGDASMAAVATAAFLHLAGGDRQFRPDSPSLTFADAWGADVVMQAMATVCTDIGLLHSQLPELLLRDWAAAATEQVVQGHIAASFAALQERITSGVKLLRTQLNAAQGMEQQAQVQLLSPAYSYLADVIQRGTTALLKGLRVYEQGRLLASWQDQLSEAVQAQLQALLQSLATHFMQAASVRDGTLAADDAKLQRLDAGSSCSADGVPNTGLVLLLAKLCVHMESTTVPCIMEVLATAFQGRSGPRGSDGPPQFVGGEVARRLGTAANLLLSSYVELHGRSLSLLVARSVPDASRLAAGPPRAAQPVCEQLLECLGRCEAEVVRLLDSTGRAPGSQHQRGASQVDALLEAGAVERGVAKLFRGKVTPFGSGGARFTQPAVLAAVVITGLKSLLEHVRLSTLGAAGLQQIQLDVCFLRPKLLALVGASEAEPVAQLLDDVLSAAAERCTEPGALLEPAAVEQLLLAAAGGRVAER